jgi:hypothetical protein
VAEGKGKPLEGAKNIETLALFIRMDVVEAVRASLVRAAADLLFYSQQNDFQNNPANTMTYRGLVAIEERATIHISEVLKNENNIFTLSRELRRILDLKFHRHALSHPVTIKWRDAEMQRFFDAKRKYRDHRVAIIWDLQRSVNEEMKRHNLTPSLETIPVHPEMGMMLGTILRLTLKPERVEGVLGGVDLHASLESLRDRWLTFLVEKTTTT